MSKNPKGSTSYKETTFGIIPRSRLLKLELQGIKRGLEFIGDLVGKNKEIKITPELICELHKTSFGWIFPDWAGKYRIVQVTISGKEAPSFYMVPELMVNLCEDLAERLKSLPGPQKNQFIVEVVKILAWFQHRFVFIHPFKDYNGRTARMFTILLLLKFGLPPVEIRAEKGVDRKKYIKALQVADEGNFSELENIITHALNEGFSKILSQKGKQ